MVRHNQMRALCPFTRLADETARVVGTSPATAVLARTGKATPQKRRIDGVKIPVNMTINVDNDLNVTQA